MRHHAPTEWLPVGSRPVGPWTECERAIDIIGSAAVTVDN